MRKVSLALLAAGLLLAGCTTAARHGQPDEQSPDYLVPVGSTLVLHQPLEVPAWQDQVYFQDGRTMSWRGVDIYLPYCTVKLADKPETAQTIGPAVFTVRKSYTELFFMQVRAPTPPGTIQPAAAGWTSTAGIDIEIGGAMDYKVVAAVMEVDSPEQPQVTRLMCADWGLPTERPHITIAKMRRALGAVMTLRRAPPAEATDVGGGAR